MRNHHRYLLCCLRFEKHMRNNKKLAIFFPDVISLMVQRDVFFLEDFLNSISVMG
uniref:Uncharacterized protein n=1 Tax=Solanum tuberosum TaxID=4113 RepID=M1D636_SOLTU